MASINSVAVGKIRFTFYKGSGPGNALGISELFFIHPEATVAYDGLMVKYDPNGNVALGTSDAQGYKLSVNGTIHSKAVNVDLNNFPDYVFKNGYKRLSLAEVKTYINKNHHLPEVPSAAEIAKNGVDLGEMNKLLVKKVEELTLYLIGKDQELKEANKRIDGLSKRVDGLMKK